MPNETRSYFFGQEIFELLPIAFGERFSEKPLKRSVECNSDCYEVHYIVEGSIVLHMDEKDTLLVEGDAFLTKPGDVFLLHQDDHVHYIWIKFRGKSALARDSIAVFHRPDGTPFLNAVSRSPKDGAYEEYIVGELYRIVSDLLKGEVQRRDYVRTIKSYIHDHPSGDVSVREIAQFVNLNRQYVSTMFSRATGISIRDYILKMRIKRAKLMLLRGHTVGECAELTGYASIYALSKAFKKVTGQTPTQYAAKERRTKKPRRTVKVNSN